MTNALPLAQTIVPDFVASLTAQSAAARIFREGLQLSFGRAGQIAVPTLEGDPSFAAFVQEGYPIPVVQAQFEPLTILTPHKLAAVVVLTSEMVQSSNVEALMQDALKRAAGLALDKALLDDVAGDATRPAGLRYGIPPLTASTAPDPVAALMTDIETLHRAVAPVTAGDAIFVMSPTRALMAGLRSQHGLTPLKFIPSPALRGTMIMMAVAPNNIVSAFGDTPEITASRETALHMETAPLPDEMLPTGPARSLFQTDCVAIKLRLPVSWGVRSSQGVSWLVTSNW